MKFKIHYKYIGIKECVEIDSANLLDVIYKFYYTYGICEILIIENLDEPIL